MSNLKILSGVAFCAEFQFFTKWFQRRYQSSCKLHEGSIANIKLKWPIFNRIVLLVWRIQLESGVVLFFSWRTGRLICDFLQVPLEISFCSTVAFYRHVRYMYVYIYKYATYMYMYIHKYICIYTHTHAHLYTKYIQICIYIYSHVRRIHNLCRVTPSNLLWMFLRKIKKNLCVCSESFFIGVPICKWLPYP